MPKKEINYQKSILYYIYYLVDLLYVGSTTNFTKRKYNHKSMYKKKCNRHLYNYLYDNNIIFDDLRFETEKVNCVDKNELFRLEGNKIRELKPIVNLRIAGRTQKEWCKDNETKIHNRRKEYYYKNQKENIEKTKIYNQNNKEKISEKAKIYYEKNKSKIIERVKNYKKNNEEKLLEKRKKKYICDCGKELTWVHKARHEKSDFHIKNTKSMK